MGMVLFLDAPMHIPKKKSYRLKQIIFLDIISLLANMLYEGGTGFNGKYIFQSFQLVKQAMLPRVHGLALKTTVAAVSILLI